MLYLYAVTDRPFARRRRGLAREPLVSVPVDELFVIVGELPDPPPVTEGALRAHDRAVRAVAASVSATVPFRFGSVVPDRATLTGEISKRRSELSGALEVVRGREQMIVRVYDSRSPRARLPRRGKGGPGARYLELRAGTYREAAAAVERLQGALARFARAERVDGHRSPPLLVTLYHLIERGRAGSYRRAARRAAEDLAPLRVTVTGPWPPYAFVTEEPS